MPLPFAGTRVCFVDVETVATASDKHTHNSNPAAEQYLLSSGPVMASQRTTFIFFIEMILFFGAYYFGKYNNLYNNGRMAKCECYANVNFDYYRILRIIGMPNFIVVFSSNHLNGDF